MTDLPPPVSYPGQCCTGYCIEHSEVHDLPDRMQAEAIVRRVTDLIQDGPQANFVNPEGDQIDHRMTVTHTETLRADRAERALAEAERRLALVLTMADDWDATWGDEAIRAKVAASAIRRAARGASRG